MPIKHLARYDLKVPAVWIHKSDTWSHHKVFVDDVSKDDMDCIETMLVVFGYEKKDRRYDWVLYRDVMIGDDYYHIYLSPSDADHRCATEYKDDNYSTFEFRSIKDNKELYEFIYKWRDDDRESEDRSIKEKQRCEDAP